jgi:hypothetical protein
MRLFRLIVVGCAFAAAASTSANAEERLFWVGNGGLITITTTPTGPGMTDQARALERNINSSDRLQYPKNLQYPKKMNNRAHDSHF